MTTSTLKDGILSLIAGPCVIESERLVLETAEALKEICTRRGVNLIFKASFDKANRSSITSYRGPGLKEGLRILAKVKRRFDLPLCTDFHLPEQADPVGEVCDILQVPAFLCRQTDMLIAAAGTERTVQVKKGQFMAPWDMKQVVDKLRDSGASEIILTDRGSSFGYNNLVSDMRCIPIMKRFGVPVCFDATHSVQLPGGLGERSGGQREFIPTLAKAALAAGADLLFMESHPHPEAAQSDAASQLSLTDLDALLEELVPLYQLMRSYVNKG